MRIENYKIPLEEHKSFRYPIDLGVQGEENVREIRFDMSDMIELYGKGTASISHRRPKDDEAYIISNSYMEGNELVWRVNAFDTYKGGLGFASISYTNTDGIAKTFDIVTHVVGSVTGPNANGNIPGSGGEDMYIDSEDLDRAMREVYGNE